MYYPIEFVFKNYKPLQFEPGQRFITKIHHGTIKEHIEIWELTNRPNDQEDFLKKNGYPVDIYVVNDDSTVLVQPEQIGWFDEGDHVDEYRDITLKDINTIIQIHDGIAEMLIDDADYDEGIITPVVIDGKAVFRFPVEEYFDEEEEDIFPDEKFDSDELDSINL